MLNESMCSLWLREREREMVENYLSEPRTTKSPLNLICISWVRCGDAEKAQRESKACFPQLQRYKCKGGRGVCVWGGSSTCVRRVFSIALILWFIDAPNCTQAHTYNHSEVSTYLFLIYFHRFIPGAFQHIQIFIAESRDIRWGTVLSAVPFVHFEWIWRIRRAVNLLLKEATLSRSAKISRGGSSPELSKRVLSQVTAQKAARQKMEFIFSNCKIKTHTRRSPGRPF